MKYTTDKDLDHYIKKLLCEGWMYERGRKHGRLLAPGGKGIATVAGSPSDYRSLQNVRRDVRRAIGV